MQLFGDYNRLYSNERHFCVMGEWAETLLHEQELLGVNIVSDGEVFRSGTLSVFFDNFYGYLAVSTGNYFLDDGRFRLPGTEAHHDLSSASFFRSGAQSRLGSIVLDRITPRFDSVSESIYAREARILGQYNKTTISQITLISPYQILRASWNRRLSTDAYPKKEDYLDDILDNYKPIIAEIERLGSQVIAIEDFAYQQVFNPTYNGILNADWETELFMESTAKMVSMIKKAKVAVVIRNMLEDSCDATPKYRTILRKLEPDYFFFRLNTGQDYALMEELPEKTKLMLNVISGRETKLDLPESMMAKIRSIAGILPLERIVLAPDFGAGWIATQTQDYGLHWRKLEQLVACARIVSEFGLGDKAEEELLGVHKRLLQQQKILK
jgi:methionine synthase II (cobalamin-independent)